MKRTWWMIVLAVMVGCDIQIGEPERALPPAQQRYDFPKPAPKPAPKPCPKPCPDGRCGPTAYDVPAIDVPVQFREANYGGGSCMHAAVVTVLRGQGQHKTAAYWRSHYSGGANVEDIVPMANTLGLRFAYTTAGDEKFLDWCSRTHRGAAIHWRINSPSDHAITFAGYDRQGYAVLIDNNRPATPIRMSRRAFLAEWRLSGGKAFTVVYRPYPPRPWIAFSKRR